MIPRHVNPTSEERTATAPYNFVPLPERIFTVSGDIDVDGKKTKLWKTHGQFVPDLHGGWIDLTIETVTPLYIRGAAMPGTRGVWDERDARVRPAPYTAPGGIPAIPGSSLRGMVRTLVEILSFSKINPVTDRKPFFRTVDDTRIGVVYRTRMARGDAQKPSGGVLVIRDGTVCISPRMVVRVDRAKLENESSVSKESELQAAMAATARALLGEAWRSFRRH